jgi:hypothetical protein
MSRLPQPCRHEFSTMAPFREDDVVFLELTEDKARALARVLSPCADPMLEAVTSQLDTLKDVQTQLSP